MPSKESSTGAQLDSARVRCLAHPLRSRLLGALRLDGPATSTTLAQRLGTNSGATSYHLRRLEQVGLVEELTDRGTARERWWQAAHAYTSWNEAEFEDDPTDHAAADWLVGYGSRVTSRWRDEWLATRHTYSRAWREAAGLSDHHLELTPDQLRSLDRELSAVLDAYRQAGPAGPHDVQHVVVVIDAFPARDLRP
jgi:DNA-binding transcriptional ArsR family regulator